MTIYNTNIDHVNDKVYTKFGKILFIHSQDIETKTNFWHQLRAITLLNICQKKTLYNINIDLVDDNVHTKFGWILSIRSQDIEQKPISDINQGL